MRLKKLLSECNNQIDADYISFIFGEYMDSDKDKSIFKNKKRSKVIKELIEELLTLEGRGNCNEIIYVIRYLDIDNDKYTYAVDLRKEGDDQNYGIDFSDWKDIVDCEVSDTSIYKYGKDKVLANILFELTFFGMDYKTSIENLKKESEELKRRIDEIKKGEAKYYTLEEVRKDLGLPEEDEKTKKKRQRELRRNIKYNEEIKKQFFMADKKEPA